MLDILLKNYFFNLKNYISWKKDTILQLLCVRIDSTNKRLLSKYEKSDCVNTKYIL